MSNVTELRLSLSELNQLSIPCQKCKTQILLDLNDAGARIPERCPTCDEDFSNRFREALKGFRQYFQRLVEDEKPVEVRVQVRSEK